MLEIHEMRMVRTIHEQGSLVRAARVMGLGQPALTRRLAALEHRLQGPLFERDRRGVVPTDLCRALLPEAIELLDRLERLNRHLREVRGAQAQTLTIGAGAYAAESICLVAAARMLAVHPMVRIRLASANWADIPRMVLEREASLGVLDVSDFIETQELAVEPLHPQPTLFVVRPGHPLLDLSAPRLADILAWPLIFLGRTPRLAQVPLAAAREEARAAGRLHPAFPALINESPTNALTAVRHSDAVASVSAVIAAEPLRAGRVVALPLREPWRAVFWAIIRPRHRRVTEAEDAYLDLLRTTDREAAREAGLLLAELGIDDTCTRMA